MALKLLRHIEIIDTEANVDTVVSAIVIVVYPSWHLTTTCMLKHPRQYNIRLTLLCLLVNLLFAP